MCKADYLKMRCTNTDMPECQACPRKFVIPIQRLGIIAMNGHGTAVISAYDWSLLHPNCGQRLRSIRLDMPYDELIKLLGGKVKDAGDVEMVYYKDTIPE
jgi:hypothetical protein